MYLNALSCTTVTVIASFQHEGMHSCVGAAFQGRTTCGLRPRVPAYQRTHPCRKLTVQRIREFRNRPQPSIVVTVDMLSTGVDIPDLEFIVFLRPVKSRILFEQMLGRVETALFYTEDDVGMCGGIEPERNSDLTSPVGR